MIEESNTRKGKLYSPLLFLAGFLLATATVGIEKESIRIVPIFVFVLIIGTGIMVELGLSRGGFVSLLLIAVWIATKQITGVWTTEQLWTSSLEVSLMGATFLFGGISHDRIGMVFQELIEAQQKLKQLDFEDTSVGLIKPSIGLLRLREEEDRSVRFHRPFALLLIKVNPISDHGSKANEETAIMRAIAANIKDSIRLVDFPFLTPSNHIAIILPETDNLGADQVIDRILPRMRTTRYISHSGKSAPIQERVQIHFGLAVFRGYCDTEIDSLKAAEQSLQKSEDKEMGNLFVNPCLERVVVGKVNETFWALSNNGVHS